MTSYTFNNKPLAVRDTGVAKLPAIPAIAPDGSNAAAVMNAMKERLEVREGSRGNPHERAVTVREFAAMAKVVEKMEPVVAAVDAILGGGGAGSASRAIDAFTKSIKELPLYKDLMKRLDDPSRFDKLPAEIREVLLRSIAEEAAKRGAEITRVEKVLQDARRSLSFEIKTVTAAVQQAQAGIREVTFATAEANFAQAGKITQLEASLGNYYQDGQPGRALLEEQMTTTADRVAGLSSQYTLKVQAGKAIAGIGLAATENTDGSATSAFIVSADKFAIVNPSTYTAGLTNTPDPAHIPFGVDANGIYMNSNVYVKGSMRIDAGGKTLADGMRGSLMANASGSWSDTAARNAIWTKLGKAGTPPNNNHLVIGDMVTMGATTRYWNGSAWVAPGVVLNGDMLVDGTVSASKVNTNGLVVRDQWGNPILGAGYSLPVSWVSGLGALAKENSAAIGSTVTMGGATLQVSDFVNRLSKINNTNIGAFMSAAAIGNAYIGNAAVSTLTIGRNAVTIPYFLSAPDTYIPARGTSLVFDTYVDLGPAVPGGSFGGSGPSGCMLVQFSFFMDSQDDGWGVATIYLDGAEPGWSINFGVRVAGGGDTDMCMPVTHSIMSPDIFGSHRISCRVTSIANRAGGWHPFTLRNVRLSVFGGKR